MKQSFSRMVLMLTILIGSLIIIACSGSKALNDFFGIKMDENDADEFNIASYTEAGGAKYYSNSRMNPQLYGWAEFDMKDIRIKVVNYTNEKVSYSYNYDNFIILTTDDESYVLIKGDRWNYPSGENINPNQSIEFILEMPANFWKNIGIMNVDENSRHFFKEFWSGENSVQTVKSTIKYIKVELGAQTTLILKPLPEN